MDWQTIFNAISDPAMILDREQHILSVNESTLAFTGMPANQLVGRHCYKVCHGLPIPPEECPVQALLSSGKPQYCTLALEVFNKTFRISVSPLFNPKGEIEKILHISRDITDQRQAEKKLAQSEEKFRTIANYTYDWEYWADPQEKFIYISPAVQRITGYTEKEFYDDAALLLKIIHPDDQKAFLEHKQQVIESHELHSLEFRISTKTGAERWISHGCRKVYSEEGKFLGFRGSNRDITDNKLAEIALAESQKRLQSILDTAPIGIAFTKNRLVQYVNKKILEVSGYRTEEIIGHSSCMFFSSDEDFERVGKVRDTQLKKDGFSAMEVRFQCKDGRIVDGYLTSAPVQFGNDDNDFIVTITDISRLKAAEAEKSQLQTRLLEAKKMETIATLAGGVAHDFNNALTCIIGSLDLVKTSPTEHKMESYLQLAEESAYEMARLTKQLLAYARGGKYCVLELHLQELINQAIEDVKQNISADHDIEIISRMDCKEDLVVADRDQLMMACEAILTNAVEAMGGSGRIEISCNDLELTEEFIQNNPGSEYGSYITFRAKDNGPGMDEETLKRIFEPFYSTKFAGRGLGMAAVYGIVKNHGGYITVDSKPGAGTTVTIYLPSAIPATAELSPGSAPAVTILLVEDEETVLEVEKRMLEVLGYHVLSAGNGKEALQVMKDHRGSIDAAIVDVHLPDITVDILYAKLIETCPTMKVLLCSGSSLEWTAQKALNAGAQGFIEKPFSMEELKEAFTKAINRC